MPFAAVEILQGETAHATVKHVMDAALTKGIRFHSLELLGILMLGRIKFIRFRTEAKAIDEILKTLDRGVVYQVKAKYVIEFPGVPSPGIVSVVTMASVGEPGIKRIYRGPGVPYWERQFL